MICVLLFAKKEHTIISQIHWSPGMEQCAIQAENMQPLFVHIQT